MLHLCSSKTPGYKVSVEQLASAILLILGVILVSTVVQPVWRPVGLGRQRKISSHSPIFPKISRTFYTSTETGFLKTKSCDPNLCYLYRDTM